MSGFSRGLKRMADEKQHEHGSSYSRKTKDTESGSAVEEFLASDEKIWVEYQKKNMAEKHMLKEKWERTWENMLEATDRKMCWQMLDTMNKTLDVIKNDQILTGELLQQLQSAVRCTAEEKRVDDAVLNARLQRLEIFNDRQYDYNDRISRVLERLAPHRVLPNGGQNSENELSASDVQLPLHAHPIIGLDGDEFDYGDFEINQNETERLIYMDGWEPPQPIRNRTDAENQVPADVWGGYDPFGPVRRKDIARLRSLIEREQDMEIDECTSLSQFYQKLLLDVPRSADPRFGWLTDVHMSRGMDLFRQRSTRTPSPYKSERIAFLDPMQCAMWCSQRPTFERGQGNTLDRYLLEMFNGETPAYCATNKVWFRDVDILYVAHHVQGVHWIALEINLVEGRIYVYDSAPNVVGPNKELFNSIK